jgi:hypothetical protein
VSNLTHFRSSLSGRQVLLFHTSACDELTPPIHRAPPRPHAGRSPAEGAPRKARLCPGPTHKIRFRCHRCFFRCVSSGSHTFVFSSHTCPATCGTSTATLTTPALNRRSLRWFGISACTANPEGPPPSLVQHASCWRSSTSSPLHFRTHVGAENHVTASDQRLRRRPTSKLELAGRPSMIARRDASTRIPGAHPRAELAGAARPIRRSQGRRDPAAPSRGSPCCADTTRARG